MNEVKHAARVSVATTAVALVVLAIFAVADLLPAGGSWTVYDDSGQQTKEHEIGTGKMSDTGNLFVFTDNPDQDHPPNTSGSWAKNSEETGYSNGGDHTVYFDYDAENKVWHWVKKNDKSGLVEDSGIMVGTPPDPAP